MKHLSSKMYRKCRALNFEELEGMTAVMSSVWFETTAPKNRLLGVYKEI